jgi:hypothetical protein
VDAEAHVAGVEANSSIWMGSAIVQEMMMTRAVASVPCAWVDVSVPKVVRRVESTARA